MIPSGRPPRAAGPQEVFACGSPRWLPELFCGFQRRTGESPTRYPVACMSQAWAAGSVLLALQACLGLQIDAPQREVRLANPRLPDWLHTLRLHGLRVGDAVVDLQLARYAGGVGVDIARREGEVRVVTLK